jgi:hypothetical protein
VIEDKIKKYFLSEMTEAETNGFEEEFAQNPELAEQVQIVENELIDAFVKNQLTQKEIKLFESNYLITEKRFEKLNFAKLFSAHLAEQPKSRTVIETANQKFDWYKHLFTRLTFAGLIFTVIGSGIIFILFSRVNQKDVVNTEQVYQSNISENKEKTTSRQESSDNSLVRDNSKPEISNNQTNSVEQLKNKENNKRVAHFQNTEKIKTQKPKVNRQIVSDTIQKENTDRTTNSLVTQIKNVEGNIVNNYKNPKVENPKNNQDVEKRQSESVSNSDSNQITNTQDASLGNNFKSDQITKLPLESKNIADLLSLQPGVTSEGSVKGGRSDQANITLNGIDVNEQQMGRNFFSVLHVTSEELQEFRVTTERALDAVENLHNSGLFATSERTLQSKGEQLIEISLKTSKLIFWLDLPKDTAKYQSYYAVIKTAEGNTVFVVSNLKSPKLVLPADIIKNEKYRIFLGGVSSENTTEYIAEYTFRINICKN